MKTHWKKLINPEYLGAYSLEDGKDLTVTIDKVTREEVAGIGGKKETCTVAYLVGQKPMILNNTNCKQIAKVVGSSYIEDWSGKQITLYVDYIKAFGENNVEALRVRPNVKKLPELNPDSPKWSAVLEAVKNKTATIDNVKAKFTITDEHLKLLK